MDFHTTKEYVNLCRNIDIADSLRFEIDKRIYYSGPNFRFPFGVSPLTCSQKLKYAAKEFIHKSGIKFKNKNIHYLNNNKRRILCNAYFKLAKWFDDYSFNVIPSLFDYPYVLEEKYPVFYTAVKELKAVFEKADLNALLSQETENLILQFRKGLASFLDEEKIEAAIIPNDLCFYERELIKACKQKNIPSFIFLHGLPGRYNNADENRTDYLLVWGDKIKENYVKAGIKENKIFVCGHPLISKPAKNIKRSLSQVLVLAKSINGANHEGDFALQDRGGLLLYLELVKKELLDAGVKNAWLRPHPSEDINWYLSNAGAGFFRPAPQNLNECLQKSSVVVGPVSTVWLESLAFGTDYVIFEPLTQSGRDLAGNCGVTPFNGDDLRVRVCSGKGELSAELKKPAPADLSFFNDYLSAQFSLRAVFDILNKKL